jgi:transposase
MHVEPHHTAEELAERIRAEPQARVAARLAAVHWAALGHAAADVAGRVLLSERQVRTWVARHNAGGTDALADPGAGARPR